MSTHRRLGRWIIGAWLICHLAALAAVPVSLCRSMRAEGAVASDEACTCTHGDGQTCPMRHAGSTPSASRMNCTCLKNAADAQTVALATMLGLVGIAPTQASSHVPVVSSTAPVARAVAPRRLAFSPDPPPPRA